MARETIELLKGKERVLVEPGSAGEARWRKAGFKLVSEAPPPKPPPKAAPQKAKAPAKKG